MTKEELSRLLEEMKIAEVYIRDEAFVDRAAETVLVVRRAAAEIERRHRLPGGLLAEAPAIPYARQAEAVAVAAVAWNAHDGSALDAAVATLRALAQETK